MKIVIAIDSLKGSLTSLEAGQAIAQGIHRVDPSVHLTIKPLADGGEGTVEALTYQKSYNLETITATGPLGSPILCQYHRNPDTNTAILEMATAAGLPLVPQKKRNPLYTTTYGVGEMIRDAIKKGCRNFIVGIGGSATNDGGIGMLQALGFRFLTETGENVPHGALGLSLLKAISFETVIPELRACRFRIACDVTNPLCGENGCSEIYGPQKGASPSMIHDMDLWLNQYAQLAKQYHLNSDPSLPGSGAAGGLGFAFRTFTNATLEPGINIILDEINLASDIASADLVITGEGRLDGQTVMGKAPIGVAKLAKQWKKPVIALAGCVEKDAWVCNQHGIDAFFPILHTIVTKEEAMDPERTKENLSNTAQQIFRLWNIKL